MEIQVGKHCQFQGCNQQDYMPFECQWCTKIHCGNHRRPDDHKCTVGGNQDSVYIIICPICDNRIQLKDNKDADTVWQEHQASGVCAIEEKKKAERELEEATKVKKCQAAKCNTKLTATNRYQCALCLMELCMSHRYEDAHDCKQLVTKDKRLQQSKLLQLGNKDRKPKNVEDNQVQESMSKNELRAFENQISTYGSSMPTANSNLYNPIVEEQERILSQFEFGGQLSSSIPASGMGKPQPSQGVGPEKCPLCDARFRDVIDLIAHTETGHSENHPSSYVPPEKRVEAQKCPHCSTRLAIAELPTHLQQEHFIF